MLLQHRPLIDVNDRIGKFLCREALVTELGMDKRALRIRRLAAGMLRDVRHCSLLRKQQDCRQQPGDKPISATIEHSVPSLPNKQCACQLITETALIRPDARRCRKPLQFVHCLFVGQMTDITPVNQLALDSSQPRSVNAVVIRQKNPHLPVTN